MTFRPNSTVVTATVALVAIVAIVGALTAASAVLAPAAPANEPPGFEPLRYVVAGDVEFVAEVRDILYAASSWGLELVAPADDHGSADLIIWLADPSAASSRCGRIDGFTEVQQHHVSCFIGGNTVVINSDRWYHGREDPHMIAPMWRRLILNHEVGHALGLPDGGPCSVMHPMVCPGEWPITPDDTLRAVARNWLAARA